MGQKFDDFHIFPIFCFLFNVTVVTVVHILIVIATSPQKCRVLHTNFLLCPRLSLATESPEAAEIFFETFGCPALFVSAQAGQAVCRQEPDHLFHFGWL